MTTTEVNQKIEWLEAEVEVNDNGTEIVMGWASADGRFEISPKYYSDLGNPYAWELTDTKTGKSYGGDVRTKASDLKRDVWTHVNYVAPAALTQQELIEKAAREWYLNRNTKFAARMIEKAQQKFGVDITTIEIPDEVKASIDAFVAKQKAQS
jgi:hypothetical protein